MYVWLGLLIGMLILSEFIECHFIRYFKMFYVFIMYVASNGIIVEYESRESREFFPDMHYNS